MLTEIKELRLSESYNFNVLVHISEQTFAANLHLSPEIITLRIMGETDPTRKFELNSWKIDELCCSNHSDSFLLMGLSLMNGGWRSLGANNRSYFENTYEIQEVFHVHSGNPISSVTQILQLNIHSPSVAQWLGHTQLQHELLGRYHQGTLHSEPYCSNTEFICRTDDISAFIILYDVRSGYSLSQFQSQMSFPPLIGKVFNPPQCPSMIPQVIVDLVALFFFLYGGSIIIDRISFSLQRAGFNKIGSYYRKGLGRKTHHSEGPALIPFEKFAKNSSENNNETSWASIIESYYRMTPDWRNMFSQYMKYCTLESAEEKFLGFFRLLEKLTFQTATFVDSEKLQRLIERSKPLIIRQLGDRHGTTSLLRRIPKLNQSKYNTEKCIANFMNQIPSEMVSEWRFSTKHLTEVCKLRNDLVHANDHQATEEDLLSMMVLIDLLLTAALAEKISIPIGQSKMYLERHKQYNYLKRMHGRIF